MSPIGIAAIVLGVGYLFVRRLAGQRVELKSLLLMPVILSAIGLTELEDLGSASAAAIGVAAAGVLVSVLIGAARGRTIGFGARDGHLWMRYRWGTILLWVLNIAAKAALVPVAALVGGGSSALAEQSIMLAIGLGILAESGVVYLRSVRAARELGVELVWGTDRDGRVRTAPTNLPRAGADTTWKS